MTLRKTLVILGVVGAVAAMAVAGTALAQTPTPNQVKTNYQQVFLDKLAAVLGKTRDELNSAFTQARNDTVDQQVKDGKLTQDQADKIKAQQGTATFGFGFWGSRSAPDDSNRSPRGAEGFMMGGADVQNAIAGALGMTAQDLRTQLNSGKTLAALAVGKEQAVKDAIVNAEKARLDQAVKDGKMTQDQENQTLDQLRNSDLSTFSSHPGLGFPGGNGGRNQAPGARSSR